MGAYNCRHKHNMLLGCVWIRRIAHKGHCNLSCLNTYIPIEFCIGRLMVQGFRARSTLADKNGLPQVTTQGRGLLPTYTGS